MSYETHSDYKTSSEFKDAFDSDSEPPQDKISEERLVNKLPQMYIFKKIYKLGKVLESSTKGDIVKFKFKECNNYDSSIKELEEIDFRIIKLGKMKDNLLDDEVLNMLQTMKKGETSIFKFEYFYFNEYKNKYLDKVKYFMIEVNSWIGISDVLGDNLFHKIKINNGLGIQRGDKNSLLNMGVKFFYGNKKNNFEYPNDKIIIKNNMEKYKELIILVETLKINEEAFFKINEKNLENFPTLKEIYLNLKKKFNDEKYETFIINDLDYNLKKDNLYIEINISDILEIFDLFKDGLIEKIIVKKGISMANPDELNKIYFDYKIFLNKKEIFKTGDIKKIEEKNYENFKYFKEEKFNYNYIEEFRISKLLNEVLKFGKKLESYSINLYNKESIKKYLNYGEDYENIKNYLDNFKENDKLEYMIKVYYFKEGENAYRMKKKKKFKHISRKYKLAVSFIKALDYKNAILIFEQIINICNYGTYEEDRIEFNDDLIRSLSNITLCYWKLNDWNKLKEFGLKCLEKSPYNEKCIYRLSLAYYKLQDFELGINTLKRIDYKNNKDMVSLMDNLQKDYNKYVNKEKNLYKNMFSS